MKKMMTKMVMMIGSGGGNDNDDDDDGDVSTMTMSVGKHNYLSQANKVVGGDESCIGSVDRDSLSLSLARSFALFLLVSLFHFFPPVITMRG